MHRLIRGLYEQVRDCMSAFEIIRTLEEWMAALPDEERDRFVRLKEAEGDRWSAVEPSDRWLLYALSRVSDLLITRLQCGYGRANMDIARGYDVNGFINSYLHFFKQLGFEQRTVDAFHPFFCEVVEVVEDIDPNVVLLDQRWPCIMLGRMMFARAGVVVSSGDGQLLVGVVDSATLFWTHMRKDRKTTDLSVGWGQNSQWSTSFRRDFECAGFFAYNVDEMGRGVALRADGQHVVEDAREYDIMPGNMPPSHRIDLLRYRCAATFTLTEDDIWPYHDHFIEHKT